MHRIITIATAALLLAPTLARAQTAPTYQGTDGITRESLGTFGQLVASPSTGTATAAATVASAGIVAKAAPGNLFGLNVASGTTAGVVQVLNTTAIPADGAIAPARCYYLAANTSLDVNLRAAPVYMSTGIVVLFSSGSSCFTKAASATAFIAADVK